MSSGNVHNILLFLSASLKLRSLSSAFTINSSWLRAWSLSGSLSRPLTTSSVSWRYDRWTETPPVAWLTWSHDLWSDRWWSREPGVSLSSQRGPDGSRIPFSPTSLQCLEIDMCHVFIVTTCLRHSAGVTMCDAWLAVITPLTSCIGHKVTKKVSIKYRAKSQSGRIEILSCLLSEMNSLYRNIDFVTRPICGRVTRYLESKYWKVADIQNNKDVTGVMTTIIQTSWSLTPGLVTLITFLSIITALSGEAGMWPVYCDVILFVTEASHLSGWYPHQSLVVTPGFAFLSCGNAMK